MVESVIITPMATPMTDLVKQTKKAVTFKLKRDEENGYPDFSEWSRQGESCDGPDTYFICFNGAEYVDWLFTVVSTKLNGGGSVPRSKLVTGAITDFYSLTGVYHLHVDSNFESHACVVVFGQENMTMYTTYGGCHRFEITKFQKRKWIDDIVAFNNATIKKQGFRYWSLWGITPTYDVIYWYSQMNEDGQPLLMTSFNYEKIL